MANEAYRAVFLRVHPTGKMVLSLTTDSDGNEPRYAQLVADELGVPALDVKVVPADTDRFGVGHGFNTPSEGAAAGIVGARLDRCLARWASWWWSALILFPGTTWHGLPTMDTLHAIADASKLVGAGGAASRSPPRRPWPRSLLAALTATWAAVFSAHALAFRAGSPLLALLPPIALVAFADTVLEEFIRPVYGLLFLGGPPWWWYLADGLRRAPGMGPRLDGARPSRLGSAPPRAGARARVVFAAMGLALIAPVIPARLRLEAVPGPQQRQRRQHRASPRWSPLANDLQQEGRA